MFVYLLYLVSHLRKMKPRTPEREFVCPRFEIRNVLKLTNKPPFKPTYKTTDLRSQLTATHSLQSAIFYGHLMIIASFRQFLLRLRTETKQLRHVHSEFVRMCAFTKPYTPFSDSFVRNFVERRSGARLVDKVVIVEVSWSSSCARTSCVKERGILKPVTISRRRRSFSSFGRSLVGFSCLCLVWGDHELFGLLAAWILGLVVVLFY